MLSIFDYEKPDFLSDVYSEFKKIERANPGRIIVGRKLDSILLMIKEEDCFLVSDDGIKADKIEIIISFHEKLEIKFQSPQKLFHPNLDYENPVISNPGFIRDICANPTIGNLILCIWRFLLFQKIYDTPEDIRNQKAMVWWIRNKENETSFKHELNFPSTTRVKILKRKPGHTPAYLSEEKHYFPKLLPKNIDEISIGNIANVEENPKTFLIIEKKQYLPEVSKIPSQFLEQSHYGSNFEMSLKIYVSESIWSNVVAHAMGDLINERIGFLYGFVFFDEIRGVNWLEIKDFQPARKAKASAVRIEVSKEEMGELQSQIDQKFAGLDKQVLKLGWYHSHPNHGVFMSQTDKNYQETSYRKPWQFALVIDNHKKSCGIFAGPSCRPVPAQNFFVIPDRSNLQSELLKYEFDIYGEKQINASKPAILKNEILDKTELMDSPKFAQDKTSKRGKSGKTRLLPGLLVLSILANILLGIILVERGSKNYIEGTSMPISTKMQIKTTNPYENQLLDRNYDPR